MDRVLVDTHALLWWLFDDPRLPAGIAVLIDDRMTEAVVSTVSLWEVAIKRSVGKLDAPDDLPGVLEEEEFTWLPVLPAHAWAVRTLPHHHRDPFDRMLIAQSRHEAIPLVSGDPHFGAYEVDVRWD
jgi:PIN domain nuclease of toxin-antitoxin system